MPNQLTITSKEISSLAAMDELFENYCKDNKIYLDFSKDSIYNAYIDRETSLSYQWFLRGVFTAIGHEHLKNVV